MTNEELKKIAEESQARGDNDLAIVLYTYIGSSMLGMGSDFARHCQSFAKEGAKQIELINQRKNN